MAHEKSLVTDQAFFMAFRNTITDSTPTLPPEFWRQSHHTAIHGSAIGAEPMPHPTDRIRQTEASKRAHRTAIAPRAGAARPMTNLSDHASAKAWRSTV
jgi:hypothetical protein